MRKLWCLILVAFPGLVFSQQTGMIMIKTEPRDADIFIDGEFKANTSPLVVELPPGEYLIKAEKGGKTGEEKIKVSAGANVIKEIKLDAFVDLLPDGNAFRDTLLNDEPCRFCPEMVWIPPGGFMMGGDGNDDQQFPLPSKNTPSSSIAHPA